MGTLTPTEALSRCRDLAAQFALTVDAEDRAGAFASHKAEAMRNAGLCALPIPRERGGIGAGIQVCSQALETLAQGDANAALGMAMHLHVMGGACESGRWSPIALNALCEASASPGIFVNAVHSEPEMGSPSRGGLPATTADPVEGGFLVTGVKRWATYAPALDYFIVSARLATAPGRPEGTGILAVARDSAGLSLQDSWADSMSLRCSGSCDVTLRDVFVPEQWLLEIRQPSPSESTLPPGWASCAFGAVYLGIAQAALNTIVRYANSRIPTALGKPIASLAKVQRAIGEIALAVRGARALLSEVAGRWDARPDARQGMAADVVGAKTACVNAAIEATEGAMRCAGIGGLERRLGLERLFRDARAGPLNPPQEDLALELIGRMALSTSES